VQHFRKGSWSTERPLRECESHRKIDVEYSDWKLRSVEELQTLVRTRGALVKEREHRDRQPGSEGWERPALRLGQFTKAEICHSMWLWYMSKNEWQELHFAEES
jgi:hypothetical protein